MFLASASPRRRDLLQQIGVQFRVETADIDETPLAQEEPSAYTLRLAITKAQTVLSRNPKAIVIGADTTVVVDGKLLGKPQNAEDATHMLRHLRNRSHEVVTGLAVLTHETTHSAVETTTVHFNMISDQEIDAYIATGEPMDKAGAYAIQGYAARWIPRIEGDYANVVGLPLARVYALLQSAGAFDPAAFEPVNV